MTTAAPPRPASPPVRARLAGPPRPLGYAWLLLAALLATVSALGPLGVGVIDWRIADLVHDQLLGLDAVSLAVVAPIAAVAGALVLRGDPRGPVLGVGPAAYSAYMAPQYVLGPDYLHMPGNNERAFPLLLAVFVLGLVTTAVAWNAMDITRLRTSVRAEALVGRVLLPIVAVAVFSRYAASLPDVMGSSPTSEEYRAGPTFMWTITLLDLGVLLPAIIAACVGMRRGAAWARPALYAVVAWLALIGIAVAGMALAMRLEDQPSMSIAAMSAMCGLAAALLATAAVLYAPLLRRSAP